MDFPDNYIKRLEALSLDELEIVLVEKKQRADEAEEAKLIASNEGRIVDWKQLSETSRIERNKFNKIKDIFDKKIGDAKLNIAEK